MNSSPAPPLPPPGVVSVNQSNSDVTAVAAALPSENMPRRTVPVGRLAGWPTSVQSVPLSDW